MIELRTLGTLDLRLRDGPELLSVLSQPKRAALLCYLVLARPRGFHRRDTLLPLFWPEADAEHARASLRQAIHRLRESLGDDAIVSRGDEDIGVARGELWCDATAFEEMLDAGEAERALGLYGGELLPGLYVEGAPEFERWLETERRRLHERAVRGAWSLAEAREREGDAAGAAEWGRRALELAPADEALLRGYMELVARAGDPGRAEEAYRGYARRLREEYELEPTLEVSALAERIQSRRSTVGVLSRRTAARGGPGDAPGAAPEGDGRHTVPDERARSGPGDPSPTGTSPASARPRLDWGGRYRWVALIGLVAVAALGFGVGKWRARPAPVPVELRSIAVLPLVDRSTGNNPDYFADGLTAELIELLGQVPGLRVPGPTSSFFFKGRTQSLPLKEIARRLGVAHVVEGSVLRQGTRVWVSVRLTNAATDRQLWTESYAASDADVPGLQNRIARHIVGRFTLKGSDIPSRPPGNPEAYDLYLQGRLALRNTPQWGGARSEQAQAIDLFRRAVAIDPSFAPAWAGLAEAHSRAHDFRPAKTEALRALALDSTLAPGHQALAAALAYGEYRWAEAERVLDRGISLAPSNGQLYIARANLRYVLGHKREAFADHYRGEALEPLLSDFKRDRAMLCWYAGCYVEGLEALDSVPTDYDNEMRLLRMYMSIGAGRRADALSLAFASRPSPIRQIVTVVSGSREEVFALAKRSNHCVASTVLFLYFLDQRNRAGASDAGRAPIVGASLQAIQRAAGEHGITCAEALVRSHEFMLPFMMRAAYADPFRSDPRFQAVMRKLGLPD